jgi:hypothetical protein
MHANTAGNAAYSDNPPGYAQPPAPTTVRIVGSTATEAVQAAPVLTLYQVPVPGSVEVTLPNGATAWGKPVQPVAPATPMPAHEPMPAWAKAFATVSASLAGLAVCSALALRIARPALGDLVDLLEMAMRVAFFLAVILGLFAVVARSRFNAARRDAALDHQPANTTVEQTVIVTVDNTGGTRLLGRAGDVNVQFGDHARYKH